MNKRMIVACLLLLLGVLHVTDWIIFSTNQENEKLDWTSFKSKYIEHLPSFLQPLYENPMIITLLLIICFTVSGLLFIKEKKKIFFVLGILSFILGFWQLFSLM